MERAIQIELDEEIMRQLKELHKTEYFADYSYQGMVHELLVTGLLQYEPDRLAEQLKKQDAFLKWKDEVSEKIFDTAIELQNIFHEVRFSWTKDQIKKRIALPVQWHED